MVKSMSAFKVCLASLLVVGFVQILEVKASGGGFGPLLPVDSPVVDQLRAKLGPIDIHPLWVSKTNLARMIVEVGYNVDKAARRLIRTAAFRKKVKADSLLDWKPSEHFTTNLPYECTGVAHDGSPVFLFPFGRWNFRNFFRGGKASDFYMYFLRMLEDGKSRIQGVNPITKKPVDQVTFIVDAKGYNLKKLLNVRATWTLMRISYAIDRHYPFLVQNWFIVNAPIIFQVFYKLIRLASSPTLDRAVQIYSSFTNRGAAALAHNIRKEAIPVYLGGTFVSILDKPAAPVSAPAPKPPVFTAPKPPPQYGPPPSSVFISSSPPQYGPPHVVSGPSPANYGPPPVSSPITEYGAPILSGGAVKATPEYGPPNFAPSLPLGIPFEGYNNYQFHQY